MDVYDTPSKMSGWLDLNSDYVETCLMSKNVLG
jgi:hypothetical protein